MDKLNPSFNTKAELLEILINQKYLQKMEVSFQKAVELMKTPELPYKSDNIPIVFKLLDNLTNQTGVVSFVSGLAWKLLKE